LQTRSEFLAGKATLATEKAQEIGCRQEMLAAVAVEAASHEIVGQVFAAGEEGHDMVQGGEPRAERA
jgi:hypothetical protein